MICYDNAEHGTAIARQARCSFRPGDPVISRSENGKLLGGSIFENYTGASIAIHVGAFAPNWINRDILFATFFYPFGQLGCRKLFGQVRSDNLHAQAFDLKLGFVEVTRIPGVFWDADLILYVMDKENCRWIKPGMRRKTDGQGIASDAA